MAEDFTGFPNEFFTFFTELAANNERVWFNANKDRYKEEVAGPICAFIEAMEPALRKISPHYVADPRPNGGSMSHIYRDVRFSKDKRPYKEHGACQFRHQAGKDAHALGFYVHLEPSLVMFGGGTWKPDSAALRRIRERIAADPAAWKKVTGNKKLKDCFGGVSGDGLKRAPKGFDPDHPLIGDPKRKSFFAMRRADAKLAGSAKFTTEVADTFTAAKPLMKFLNDTHGTPF
ncbi:MAG: DUF2461 domain-containing protein [Rhodospirillales bacterium]|jgi:uncharacterized protein (TIGR02453 family)|nr:DUF2461 domain-containing protein [Rhodospirillales bacterium]